MYQLGYLSNKKINYKKRYSATWQPMILIVTNNASIFHVFMMSDKN